MLHRCGAIAAKECRFKCGFGRRHCSLQLNAQAVLAHPARGFDSQSGSDIVSVAVCAPHEPRGRGQSCQAATARGCGAAMHHVVRLLPARLCYRNILACVSIVLSSLMLSLRCCSARVTASCACGPSACATAPSKRIHEAAQWARCAWRCF